MTEDEAKCATTFNDCIVICSDHNGNATNVGYSNETKLLSEEEILSMLATI